MRISLPGITEAEGSSSTASGAEASLGEPSGEAPLRSAEPVPARLDEPAEALLSTGVLGVEPSGSALGSGVGSVIVVDPGTGSAGMT